MGLIPAVDQPAPAFVHIDVDDLRAIAECYGYTVPEEFVHHITQQALPRFQQLFAERNISATFFLVGRDLESPQYCEQIRALLAADHRIANHSYTHALNFRDLTTEQLTEEIRRTHRLCESRLGVTPSGFRAPGYAWTPRLTDCLHALGYRYDASPMPSPYGGIFRALDKRMQKPGTVLAKTQYPLLGDTWRTLYPAPWRSTSLTVIPSATSPMLRLPFQAGVCMRLGPAYFRTLLAPYRLYRALPLVFLFHAADLADFSQVPVDLFRQSSFFASPLEKRLALARLFLREIQNLRAIQTTEDWLSQ